MTKLFEKKNIRPTKIKYETTINMFVTFYCNSKFNNVKKEIYFF